MVMMNDQTTLATAIVIAIATLALSISLSSFFTKKSSVCLFFYCTNAH